MPTPVHNSPNPFASSDLQTAGIRSMLAERIVASEPSPLWQGRALELAASVAPLLAGMESATGDKPDSTRVKALLQFDNLVSLVGPQAGVPSVDWSDLTGLSTAVVSDIRAYLDSLPVYHPSRPFPKDSPARQVHGYALFALLQRSA